MIESTGISEPEQVAETFTAELANALVSGALGEGEGSIAVDEKEMLILKEIADMGGLTKLAYLDTCVTVVDAYNLFNNLHTADFLSDRWGKDEEIAPEDERTISDLLVDQIEFASIILVNKIDQVDDDQRKKVLEICAVLNPSAKVIETRYSRVDVKEVINTGLYDYGKAKMGSGWLKSLHELSLRNVGGKMKMAPKPETEEYLLWTTAMNINEADLVTGTESRVSSTKRDVLFIPSVCLTSSMISSFCFKTPSSMTMTAMLVVKRPMGMSTKKKTSFQTVVAIVLKVSALKRALNQTMVSLRMTLIQMWQSHVQKSTLNTQTTRLLKM